MSILAPLLLFTTLTAYSPIASAINWQDCVAKLTGRQTVLAPHAVAYDEVKEQTFTRLADDFMQVMWMPILQQQNLLLVKSDFFTEFIAKNLPELERAHIANYELMKSDTDGLDLISRLKIEVKYDSVWKHIEILKQRISRGSIFSYREMLAFSKLFATVHELEAHKKIEGLLHLKDKDQSLQARYPGAPSSVISDLVYKTPRGVWSHDERINFWLSEYAMYAQYPENIKKMFRSSQIIMPLPTTYPTGSFAFYATYHLPVTPIFMAKEFELKDYVELISPLANSEHDEDHNRGVGENANSDFVSPAKSEALRKKLEDIRALVKQRGNPELLKTLYYAFLFLKFERPHAIPYTLSKIIEALKIDYDNFYGKRQPIYNRVVNLFPTPFAPAKDAKNYLENLSEVIYIISAYQSQNSWHARASHSLRLKNLLKEKTERDERIKVWN